MPTFREVSRRSGLGGASSRRKAGICLLEALLGTPSLGLEIKKCGEGAPGEDGTFWAGKVFRGEGGGDLLEIGIDLPLAANPFGLFLNSALGLSVEVGLDGDNLS